jgi:hypothetical protein
MKYFFILFFKPQFKNLPVFCVVLCHTGRAAEVRSWHRKTQTDNTTKKLSNQKEQKSTRLTTRPRVLLEGTDNRQLIN